MIRVFVSYAHADESLCQELGKHLASLYHQGLIDVWHDRRIDRPRAAPRCLPS